jgi:hypothetical protein
MKFKKVFLVFLLVSMAIIAWVGYRAYTRTNPDLGKVRADIIISADSLIAAFEKDDSSANNQFISKTIEVSGLLKKISKDDMGDYSLAIGDSSSMAAVRCSVGSNHRTDAALLRENTSVTVRGACTGFNKDELGLGAEVILNRCVIIKK